MEKREIKQIKVSEIMEHPNNPRKDLGDLEELTESIRLHGVMQNLLVIEKDQALEGLMEEYEKTPSGIYVAAMDWIKDNRTAKYIVLLGHRRLAAAGDAGLETVPCVVSKGMPLNDQISLMLLENMQRNNLTIVEEAESFQMMLDLGDTISGVAEKSGFSETTVRHRVELAKLDKKKLEKALKSSDSMGYQLTLSDLAKLEKVGDIKERNRILDNSSSRYQIDNAVTRWIEDQQTQKHEKIILEKIAEISGREIGKPPKDYKPWDGKYKTLLEIETDRKPEPVLKKKENKEIIKNLPADAFFVKDYHRFKIVTKRGKAEKKLTAAEEKAKEIENRIKEIKNITRNGVKSWKERIMQYLDGSRTAKKELLEKKTAEIFNLMERKGGWTGHRGMSFYKRCTQGSDNDWWGLDNEEKDEWIQKYQETAIEFRMLFHIVDSFKSDDLVGYRGEYQDGQTDHYRQMLEILETVAEYEETDTDFIDVIEGKSELFKKRNA